MSNLQDHIHITPPPPPHPPPWVIIFFFLGVVRINVDFFSPLTSYLLISLLSSIKKKKKEKENSSGWKPGRAEILKVAFEIISLDTCVLIWFGLQ